MIENRLHNRLPIRAKLTLEGGQLLIQAQLVDLSLSGFGAELSAKLNTAVKLLASFRLPNQSEKISTWCVPVWQAKTGTAFRVGFQFTNLDSSHHSLIADHLAMVWQASHRAG